MTGDTLTMLGALLLGAPLALAVVLLRRAQKPPERDVRAPPVAQRPVATPPSPRPALPPPIQTPAPPVRQGAPEVRPRSAGRPVRRGHTPLLLDLDLPLTLTYAGGSIGGPRPVTLKGLSMWGSVSGQAPRLLFDAVSLRHPAPRRFRHDRIMELQDLRTGEIVTGPAGALSWAADLLAESPAKHYAYPATCPHCRMQMTLSFGQFDAWSIVPCIGCNAELHLQPPSQTSIGSARRAVMDVAGQLRQLARAQAALAPSPPADAAPRFMPEVLLPGKGPEFDLAREIMTSLAAQGLSISPENALATARATLAAEMGEGSGHS